jgi:hypothetical protein
MRYLPADTDEPDLLKIFERELKPNMIDRLRPNARVVIKDVHICLALEFLSRHLEPLVIILLRHPCALANSWNTLDLEVHSRIDLLLSQELLVRRYLAPFMEHMRSREEYHFVIGAYWGASYFILNEMSAAHPEWQWATHESLCVDMSHRYELLLNNLDIVLTDKGKRNLDRYLSKNDRARGRQEGPYSLARLSALEPEKWRDELTEEQIKAVFDGASPFGIIEKFEDVGNALV